MIPLRQLLAYGVLALPLAWIALPLYVYMPKYYADHFGMSLEVIGMVLMMARLIDTLQDPYIGWWLDRRSVQPEQLRDVIMIMSPFMSAGFVLLIHPMPESVLGRTMWLGGLMVLTYTTYSLISIAYQSLATAITLDYTEQSRITGAREAFALGGVLVGAALPSILTPYLGEKNAMSLISMLLIPIMMILAYITCRFGPFMRTLPYTFGEDGFDTAVRKMFRNENFKRLITVYWINGVASALPAVLVLFFVEGVLKANHHAGFFLATYFLSGAIGMPWWVWLSRRIGKKRAWMTAMIGSVFAFLWASFLKQGDIEEFYWICALSGLCLGGDLAIPPAILADTLGGNPRAGKHFGMLSFFGKLALALGSGLGLFLLGVSGYRSDSLGGAMTTTVLSSIYCLLPCLIRVFAIHLLGKSHIDERRIQLTS